MFGFNNRVDKVIRSPTDLRAKLSSINPLSAQIRICSVSSCYDDGTVIKKVKLNGRCIFGLPSSPKGFKI